MTAYCRLAAGVFLLGLIPATAQFGGRQGDVVIYAVTVGPADFQSVPASTTNSSQGSAAFRVTSLASVPVLDSNPFPLERQPLYVTPTESFAVGTDVENTVGLHRIFLYPVKIFQSTGILNPIGNAIAAANTLISFPKDLDVEGDLALTTERIITWFPGQWPFIAQTNTRGPLGPKELPGFVYLLTTPGLVKLPSLMPWLGISQFYPGAGWQSGIDQKILDVDASVGTTIRQIRLRPGTRTPAFRLAGHTHLFVLQGNVTITPSGANPIALKSDDYVFVPENFVVTLSNPRAYSGPGTR